jgi:pyridoxal 5'-phosphate synthase pdxT subunit
MVIVPDAPIIGVLALQGAFAKHIEMLRTLGVQAREVRKSTDLAECRGLIIPGGESTAILAQMRANDLVESLTDFAKRKPIFGTCAGLILMSQEVVGSELTPLRLLDIQVERNAFGRQNESFQTTLDIKLEDMQEQLFFAIFIRAPRIRRVGGAVDVLGKHQDEPVLVRQGLFLGSTFHPELGVDHAIHAYFLKMVTS